VGADRAFFLRDVPPEKGCSRMLREHVQESGDVKFRVPVRFPGCDVYGFAATRTTPLSTTHRSDPHEETQLDVG
jgi:hypothetical protein